ncbi:sodium/substrate symport [Vibrio fortis]|uniref:Sodium/substrate symport n=1 Tax=Vibrio fortis TaxID=212667 RepID=A0A5N3S9Y9_9VIBR|nr:sodium/substrate symport [Vibrio fortis]KAB0303277.1 sodium/substrate symport [Vibrio fortis]|tara:strand:- start:7097 stop:8857 length:1761 start_codon:yes stop_codon:yes gene_type:complete
MVSSYDLGAIVFYFIFMVLLGFVFRKQVSNTSEYFRGGGKMIWWMGGASAFMTTFSAWTFTGAAGKAYIDGFAVVWIFIFNILGYLLCARIFAPRFRQMDVVTPMEAIRQRFGAKTERFYTTIYTVTGLMGGSITLYAVSIFISAVLGWDIQFSIIITGLAVVLMTVTGGSWAVVSSDFLQAMLIVGISVVTFIAVLNNVDSIDSITSHWEGDTFWTGNGIEIYEVFLLWVGALLIQRLIDMNNIGQSVRFLCVKDSAQAKKAAYFTAALFAMGSIMWFLPPMWAAGALEPLNEMYPQLGGKANQAAYLSVVQTLLPAGMVGLVVSAMFAATMSTLDSRINFVTASFIKSIYKPIINKNATEVQELRASKIATTVMGLIVIACALFLNELRGISLFSMMILFAGLVNIPMMIPQTFCMFVKRVPDWAGWATVLFGFCVSIISNNVFNAAWVSETIAVPMTGRELGDLGVVITQFMHAILTVGFFFATMLFYKEPVGERKEQVELFFKNQRTPIVSPAGMDESDVMQCTVLGRLTLIFGAVITAFAVLPNENGYYFMICGLFIMAVGGAIYAQRRNGVTVKPITDNL